jgi:hypothetical protein
MRKSLGIVVPVYNQVFYTKKLIDSFIIHKQSAYEHVYFLIVDNASTDTTKDDLIVYSDFVTVIKNEYNKGFAPAVNQGIQHWMEIDPDIDILVMNNDMEFIDGCIDELEKVLEEKKDAGVVGGKLLFADGIVQHGGAFLNLYGWGQHKNGGRKNKTLIDEKVEEQEYVTGALLLIKNDVLKLVKGFDEEFSPAFFEEVDFIYSIRKLGFKTYYTPFAKAFHYENTTGKALFKNQQELKKQLSDSNQIKFYLKREKDEYEFTSEERILLTCKIYGNWSFSGVMRNLAKGLKRNGVDVSIAPEEYHMIGNMEDWEVKEMINKPIDYWNRYVLRSSEGDHMYLLPPGKKRIAHTTGESTRVNRYWIDQLNNTDQVLTTSTFFANVMGEGGVKTPIDVVPNSVDIDVFNPDVEKYPMTGLRGFNFYSVFPFGERKGYDILLKAFVRAFEPEDNVTLTIHSLSMEQNIKQLNMTPGQWVESFCQGKKHAPIFLSSQLLDDSHLVSLINNFNVLVFPSRAEGFGLGLIEAGACGKPCIATNYSGMTDYLIEDVGWGIDYTLKDIPLQYLPYFKNYVGGKWAEPNVEHLIQLMRYVYNNQDEVKVKGKNALERTRTLYSIDHIGKQAKEAIWR